MSNQRTNFGSLQLFVLKLCGMPQLSERYSPESIKISILFFSLSGHLFLISDGPGGYCLETKGAGKDW